LLDSSVAGYELKVRKPSAEQYALTLKPMAETTGADDDEPAAVNPQEGDKLQADPAHPSAIQGSYSGQLKVKPPEKEPKRAAAAKRKK
jgi:hypothetical protein